MLIIPAVVMLALGVWAIVRSIVSDSNSSETMVAGMILTAAGVGLIFSMASSA